MAAVLADLAASQWPMIFAVFAGVVGAAGIITAIMAHASVSKDRSSIATAESALVSPQSWEGAHTRSEHQLSGWFRERSIDPESGVADVIRACWSAWLGSRATSLTELHVLVARRERSKAPARISAGIAALLLIIGIVGTLFSVKPILSAFEFRTSAPVGELPADDGAPLVNIEDSTALVNSLMHSLGDAFLPSLVALLFTILVVFARGFYSLELHRYTLKLDRFAMATVMPHFRPRSISEEYEEVRDAFDSLAKTIGAREEKFDKVVEQLTKFVDSVGPTLEGLDTGIKKMTTAADALATKSNSIAATLTRTLGKKSPLYAAVNGFEGIFATTNERLDELSQHIGEIGKKQQEDRRAMLATLEEISGVINQVSGDHQNDRDVVAKNVGDLRTVVEKLPADLLASAKKSFDDEMAAMSTTLKQSLDKQSADARSAHAESRSKTEETLKVISQSLADTITRINDSVKDLPAAIGILDEALKQKTEIEKAAASAIDSLASEAKASIRRAAADADHSQRAPVTLVPTSYLDPKTDEPQASQDQSVLKPDGETPVTPESEHEERGRGFLGGFFGGRKS